MKKIRFITTALAAGVLLLAAGCKSTTTTTTTTPATTVSTTDNGTTTTTSYSTPASATSSTSTTTSTTSLADNGTTTTVATPAAETTVTNPDGSTTTTLANGNTITRAATTTVVYPNGTVQTLPADGSTTVNTANGAVPAVPPGAAIVTKTVTTITTKQGAQQIAQAAPQPIYITTTPANVYANNPPPMTSSTTIYQPYPYRTGHGRRFPQFNLLAFADRASFSNSNRSLNGTVNSGQFSSDIRNENGWGGGINWYLGRTNLSTEFTYSSIQPRATFTPVNTTFQPITNFRFKMQPVTGTLQLHFNPRSSVDAYIGGGGAYVMFKPTSNNFPAGTNVSLKNEWGPLVNAGIGFGFSPNFGINFDAKYMWVRANATPTFNSVAVGNVGNSERIGVNPFVVSAGLRFGF